MCESMYKILLLDQHLPGPIRLVLLVIGWLVGWLVGNTVFSETALRIFLIFCMKLGDYKGRKVTVLDFWKKFLIWRYSRKSLQISPKSDTDIFSHFWPEVSTKYDLQFEWNLFFNSTNLKEMERNISGLEGF